MKSLPCVIILLTACSAERDAERPLHRFEPTAQDLERLEAGELPLLILKEGQPCPGALFTTEEWIPDHPKFGEYGLRERILADREPGVLRADARGIVWYTPAADYYWLRRASSGDHVWSHPFLGWNQFEVRAAARAGILWPAAELLETSTWSVRIKLHESFAEQAPPVFFLRSLDDPEVLFQAARRSASEYRTPRWQWNSIDEHVKGPPRLCAGLDLMRAVPLPEPGEAAEFDLRDCGAIEVQLLDEIGAPILEPRAVYLAELESKRAEEFATNRWAMVESPHVVSENGRALFIGVPPGKRWRIGAHLVPGSAAVSVEAEGPVEPGQTLSLTLSTRESAVLVRARITGEDGLPAIFARGEIRGEGRLLTRFRTDADGRMIARVPIALINANDRLEIVEEFDASQISRRMELPAAALLEHVVEHAWLWREDTSELFAQGRVVDREGFGIPFADVMALMDGGTAHADARGYFIVNRMTQLMDPDELDADSPWHLTGTVSLEPGQRNLMIQLERGARIAGVLAPSFRNHHPTVSWLRPGATQRTSTWQDWWSREGEFEIGPIPVDATEVQLEFNGEGTAVLRNLVLEPGKVFRYPEPVQPRK